jgi:hypothetical protein
LNHLIRTPLLGLALALAASCSADDHGRFTSALTGEACEPGETYVPHGHSGENGNGGHNSPTGIPGDNLDDEHSGKVDCYYDGNSGAGNDTADCIPEGCDAELCCDEDAEPVDPEGGEEGGDSGTPEPTSDDGNVE